MKSFLDLIKEEQKKDKHHVIAFGRMNPPTTGHLKMIDKVKGVAEKNKASHSVIVSHSQDAKKNPLSGEQKVKHLKRYSPGTHFVSSSKEHPTILHHAAAAHAKGVTHLHVVAGSDRVKEYHTLLHKYNGVKGTHGHYNFKKITVHSAGHRDPDAEGAEGMSATKMREHAKNKDFSSFRHGVPSHVHDTHAKELMHDVRKGMGLNEQINRGQFKAIFVTGGPGSGKDVIIREAIPESKIVELNFVQACDYLGDKQKLSEKSNDFRKEGIRQRMPLIINGPADNTEKITYIKEELEELGYQTMMIFVNTTNEISKQRNESLSRMMLESVRTDKWNKSQKNIKTFNDLFENFTTFDNTGNLDTKEEDISDIYKITKLFLDSTSINESAEEWLNRNSGIDLNLKFTKLFKEDKNVKKPAKQNNISVQSSRKSFGSFRQDRAAKSPADIAPDNRPNDPNSDNIKWDANKRPQGTYIFRTYEEKEAGLQIFPEPKESNFSKDKEKVKQKGRLTDAPTVSQRIRNVSGVGPEFDTRQQGTVYPMSGLGDVTYREQKEFKKFREAIDHYTTDMGVAGSMGGSSNKELVDTYFDKTRNIGTISKKKKDKK